VTPDSTPSPAIARAHPRLVAAALAGVALLLTACGSSSTSTASSATTTVAESTSGTQVAQSMRTKRYCEVLLVHVIDGQATADVYNSYPLNDCPAELWAKLDAKTIANAEGVTLAVLNGPRYWLMDRVDKQGGTDGLTKKDFGGIEMYRQASVAIGSLADAAKPYTPHEVDRATVFTFDAGRTVYELTAPDGTMYVMQTWSQQKDPTLTEADLAGLGSRLHLPPGWTYRSRTLDAPLQVVTTTTNAKVLQDDLSNSYSQETGSQGTQ
jgi:hypothetical protein